MWQAIQLFTHAQSHAVENHTRTLVMIVVTIRTSAAVLESAIIWIRTEGGAKKQSVIFNANNDGGELTVQKVMLEITNKYKYMSV